MIDNPDLIGDELDARRNMDMDEEESPQPVTVLTENPGSDGSVTFHLVDGRWPVRIVAANKAGVDLDDQEARALLKILQGRYLDGLEWPFPKDVGQMRHWDESFTLTDPYKCKCGDKHDKAAVIIGDDFWCSRKCFAKNPPKGWKPTNVDQVTILAALKATQATELWASNAHNARVVDDQKDIIKNLHHHIKIERDGRRDERAKLSVASASLSTVCAQLGSASTALFTASTRISELETIIENGDKIMSDKYLENSLHEHDETPTMEQMVADTVNKQVQKKMKKMTSALSLHKCSICNKTLANASGVAEHQRATKCGTAIAKVVADPTWLEKTRWRVQLAEVSYKASVVKMQAVQAVIQTSVRCVTAAATASFIAYHIL